MSFNNTGFFFAAKIFKCNRKVPSPDKLSLHHKESCTLFKNRVYITSSMQEAVIAWSFNSLTTSVLNQAAA